MITNPLTHHKYVVGVQVGTGGVAVYSGVAVGGGLFSGSITLSNSSVNTGYYVTGDVCFRVLGAGTACGGLNTRGNVSGGLGLSAPGGGSIQLQMRHGTLVVKP